MADTKKNEYVESDAVRAAKAALEQQQALKPGAYQSQWQTSLNEAMDKILNREKFTYDLNGDALYQQYKDRYVKQGQQAMMDTMGQAATMTGGYGNSYAQTAGQQTFQGYLEGLNDKVPELYQMALDRYNQEGQDLYNEYGLYADREDMDYGRYRDQLGDWEGERNYLSGQYDTERGYDYGQYRDQVSDSQWQTEFDEAIKRFLATADPATRQYYENYGKLPETPAVTPSVGSGSSVGGGSSSGGSKVTTGGGSLDQIAKEVMAGKWGNGTARKEALAKAGYDYSAVQAAVNKLMESDNDPKKDNPTKAPTGIVEEIGDPGKQLNIANYVQNMLDNIRSSSADPRAIIKADSKLSASQKMYALEVLNAYIAAGYMKTP